MPLPPGAQKPSEVAPDCTSLLLRNLPLDYGQEQAMGFIDGFLERVASLERGGRAKLKDWGLGALLASRSARCRAAAVHAPEGRARGPPSREDGSLSSM
eukprot:g15672.t1